MIKRKEIVMPARKRIALIAHDNMKADLLTWVEGNLSQLKQHEIFATGTTGHLLKNQLGLDVHAMISGPLGGDQQIGAMLTTQNIDIVIFFWDPFEAMPHDPDVKALLRLASVWNVPVACNRTTADFLISSPLFATAHSYEIPDYESYLRERTQT